MGNIGLWELDTWNTIIQKLTPFHIHHSPLFVYRGFVHYHQNTRATVIKFLKGTVEEYFISSDILPPVPVAPRSKVYVCGRSPAEIVGSNPTMGRGCLSVVSVVCCQVEVSWLVRRCVWSRNFVNEKALAHWGLIITYLLHGAKSFLRS